MSYGLEQKVTWLWTQRCPHTCTGGKPGCFSRWSSQMYCFFLCLILKSRSDTGQGENRWGTGNRWGGNDTSLGLLYSLSYAVEILIDVQQWALSKLSSGWSPSVNWVQSQSHCSTNKTGWGHGCRSKLRNQHRYPWALKWQFCSNEE